MKDPNESVETEETGHASSSVGVVHPSTASFPGFTHADAVEAAVAGISEPLLGRLDASKIQLCPQNISTLNEELCTELSRRHSNVEFRIHANTSCGGVFGLHDASSDRSDLQFRKWKSMLAVACRALGAPAYTWHAGRSSRANLHLAVANTLDLEQELGIPVGIEGLYPSKSTPWLMSSFDDYRTVMNSGAAFAVDLSHWQIIATAEHEPCLGLLEDLLTHPRCIEVHMSDNDGRRDGHRSLSREPFWFSTFVRLRLEGLVLADVFSEGQQTNKAECLVRN